MFEIKVEAQFKADYKRTMRIHPQLKTEFKAVSYTHLSPCSLRGVFAVRAKTLALPWFTRHLGTFLLCRHLGTVLAPI